MDITDSSRPELAKIKSSATFRPSFTRHLSHVGELLHIGNESQSVVMNAEETTVVGNRTIWSMRDWLLRD